MFACQGESRFLIVEGGKESFQPNFVKMSRECGQKEILILKASFLK